uniref:Uncharacterized protein n=1 Tax=Leersia perrieri TaxID=77586 RepID=A0A0D9VDH5_9ORYZ
MVAPEKMEVDREWEAYGFGMDGWREAWALCFSFQASSNTKNKTVKETGHHPVGTNQDEHRTHTSSPSQESRYGS